MASFRQRDFRGALLQTCGERMGKETWNSFCFLYAIPEGVREKGRSAVLEHLVNEGEISSEKPGEFAERLRKDLGHAALAQFFLGKSSHYTRYPADHFFTAAYYTKRFLLQKRSRQETRRALRLEENPPAVRTPPTVATDGTSRRR